MNLPQLDWKKILIIIGFLAFSAGIGLTIHYLFFRAILPPGEEEPAVSDLTGLPISETGEIAPGQELPAITPAPAGFAPPTEIERAQPIPEVPIDEVAQGSITKVTDIDFETTPSFSPDASGNNLLTYNSDTGRFYQMNDQGQKTLLTEKQFPDVQTIAWAPTSKKAILEFPDGSNILYDFQNDRQTTLPKSWTEFNFNSTETKIGFKDLDPSPERRFLGIANPDGSGQQYIDFLGDEDQRVIVQWSPDNQYVAAVPQPDTGSSSKIYFIGQNQENFKSLSVDGFGIKMQFTPDSQKMIYSVHNNYNDNKPRLYMVNSSPADIGTGYQDLNIETWADKCTIHDSTAMYCAVPREMPDSAGWFPELANNIADDIYRVNLQTGAKSFLAQPEYNLSIEKVQVSADGSTLFFTDRSTQTVHQIKLK